MIGHLNEENLGYLYTKVGLKGHTHTPRAVYWMRWMQSLISLAVSSEMLILNRSFLLSLTDIY